MKRAIRAQRYRNRTQRIGLGDALERDDRQMPLTFIGLDDETKLISRLSCHQRLRPVTWRLA